MEDDPHGGFPIALAAVLVWAATGASDAVREGVLIAAAVSTAGMAAGRLVSRVVEPTESSYPWIWFGVEVVLVALLVVAV